jgi:hypothetical protein
MARPALEVADIFRADGPAWRTANAGHVSLGQLKVMSAIERCRTAALGGAALTRASPSPVEDPHKRAAFKRRAVGRGIMMCQS